MEECCAQCRFYKPINESKGRCRARSPKAFFLTATPVMPAVKTGGGPTALRPIVGTFWPEPDAVDWCGEFKSRNSDEIAPVMDINKVNEYFEINKIGLK